MLNRARYWIRKSVFKTYRWLKHPRRLKSSPALRWFARHFLDKDVWRPCQRSFAAGVAIGVFASAQLLPGQSLIGVVLAAIFRANIPTVVLVTWISNPVTFAPIGIVEKQFGDWLLATFGGTDYSDLGGVRNPDVKRGIRFAQSMYLGGLIGGLLATPIAYALAWFSWTAVARLLRIPLRLPVHLPVHLRRRPKRPVAATGAPKVEDAQPDSSNSPRHREAGDNPPDPPGPAPRS
jgi:uncharacterized protein (DUF2062 family)